MTTRILVALTALVSLLAAIFRGNAYKEMAKSAKDDLDQEKAAHLSSQKATEAMVKGLNEEAKPVARGHFDK